MVVIYEILTYCSRKKYAYLYDFDETYLEELEEALSSYDYISVKCNSTVKYRDFLVYKGLIFADRSICIDLSLKEKGSLDVGNKYIFQTVIEWDVESVYLIAMDYFNEDPRFVPYVISQGGKIREVSN